MIVFGNGINIVLFEFWNIANVDTTIDDAYKQIKNYQLDIPYLFFVMLLISIKKKWEIAKIAQGKSIVHINEKSLAKIDIEFPCIAEWQKIVNCLSVYNEAIQIKKDKLEVWKEIKKGLLQQMFV